MPNEACCFKAANGIGNLAFYRMCADFSGHDRSYHVQNKLVFISRVYSVSRGLGGQWDQLSDALTEDHVEFDHLIKSARSKPFLSNIPVVLEAHAFLDDITCKVLREAGKSAFGRASFASKYLHFHAPDSFPILDKLASDGLASFTPRFQPSLRKPKAYPRFCERLAHYMEMNGKRTMSLRHIDTELVEAGKRKSEH